MQYSHLHNEVQSEAADVFGTFDVNLPLHQFQAITLSPGAMEATVPVIRHCSSEDAPTIFAISPTILAMS